MIGDSKGHRPERHTKETEKRAGKLMVTSERDESSVWYDTKQSRSLSISHRLPKAGFSTLSDSTSAIDLYIDLPNRGKPIRSPFIG